jgi:hypothetical protein
MPARLFRCTLENVGAGDIAWVNDSKDHGDWSEGMGPSEQTRLIRPGETRSFQAESGGVMTGTEGWATFTLTTGEGQGDAHAEFVKVYWNLPYVGARQVVVEKARFDPDTPHDTFEWTGRDTRPAVVAIQHWEASSESDLLTQVQNVPAMLMTTVAQIWEGPYMTDHWFLQLRVLNTLERSSTTIPFPATPPPPQTTSRPMTGSTADLWVGPWEGEGVRITIEDASSGHLNVTVEERASSGERTFTGRDVAISRPDQVAARRRQNVEGAGRQGQGIGGRARGRLNQGIEMTRDTAQPSPYAHTLEHDVERPAGDAVWLNDEAVLEIYRVEIQGQMVGQALHYRRPASGPARVAMADVRDVMLYRTTFIR